MHNFKTRSKHWRLDYWSNVTPSQYQPWQCE